MGTEDDTRSVDQQVAAGQSERTPVTLITSVVGVVAVLFLLALGLAALAYWLA
jgi:CHASE3 domain sensor protein